MQYVLRDIYRIEVRTFGVGASPSDTSYRGTSYVIRHETCRVSGQRMRRPQRCWAGNAARQILRRPSHLRRKLHAQHHTSISTKPRAPLGARPRATLLGQLQRRCQRPPSRAELASQDGLVRASAAPAFARGGHRWSCKVGRRTVRSMPGGGRARLPECHKQLPRGAWINPIQQHGAGEHNTGKAGDGGAEENGESKRAAREALTAR